MKYNFSNIARQHLKRRGCFNFNAHASRADWDQIWRTALITHKKMG
jgi:hypothetical protein